MIFGTPEYDDLLVGIVRKGLRHANYHDACKFACEMNIHIFGEKPVKLLERSRPREDDEVKNYRLENYEPETKAAADKAIDIFSKMFNPMLYSIVWKGKGANVDKLKDYTTFYYPDFNSVVNYNKDVVLRKMFADANGLIAVKPQRMPESDKEEINPIIALYGSENIYFEDLDHYLVFIASQASRDGTETFTFEYFDYEFWREFEVTTVKGEEDKVIIDTLFEYRHGFTDKNGNREIPAWKLRGKPEAKNDGTWIYKSFIHAAAPHWNLSITHNSDLLGAYINHIHPQRWALAEECNHKFSYEGTTYDCRNGMIHDPIEKRDMICPKCAGSGKIVVKSPYETFLITKSKLDALGDGNNVPIPPTDYITVPTDATKMLEERVEKLLRRGMWAINMDVEDDVGENQSGIAKVIDRSAQYDTLYNVSSVMFDVHLQNEIYFINKWKFGVLERSAGRDVNDNLPEINKPTQFNVQSVGEMMVSFDAGKKSGLDPSYLQTQQKEIVSKDLSTNPDEKERTLLILKLDPFPGKTPDEIDVLIKYARETDAIIHFNLSDFVDKALEEHDNFKEMESSQQKEILTGYAEEIRSEKKMQLDAGMFSPDV